MDKRRFEERLKELNQKVIHNRIKFERQQGDLISREWLEDAFDNLCCHNCKKCRNFRIEDSFYKCALIDNAPTVEERMFYVQETVNTILNSCTSNTDIDKAFRNAARLVQNAIDGKSVNFEEIGRSEEE